jgi:hypothetical protein
MAVVFVNGAKNCAETSSQKLCDTDQAPATPTTGSGALTVAASLRSSVSTSLEIAASASSDALSVV